MSLADNKRGSGTYFSLEAKAVSFGWISGLMSLFS